MTRKRSHSSMAGRPLPSSDISDNSSIKDQQDHFLPTANVSRIMKKSLPANAKISKEAKESVQECVTEFINFITGEASEKCQMEKRKTINGDDLLWAMSALGFENYLEPLKVYLSKYRETEGEKNSMAMKEDHSATSSSNNSLGDHLSTETTILTPKGKGVHEKSENLYGEGFSATQQFFHTNLADRNIHGMDENAYGAVAANLHQW